MNDILSKRSFLSIKEKIQIEVTVPNKAPETIKFPFRYFLTSIDGGGDGFLYCFPSIVCDCVLFLQIIVYIL